MVLLVDVDCIADNKILFLSDTLIIDCFDIGTIGSDFMTGPTTGIMETVVGPILAKMKIIIIHIGQESSTLSMNP